jgi:hypothetical protein
VLNATGQSLAYLYARENVNAAAIAKVLTLDEARRIAAKHRQITRLTRKGPGLSGYLVAACSLFDFLEFETDLCCTPIHIMASLQALAKIPQSCRNSVQGEARVPPEMEQRARIGAGRHCRPAVGSDQSRRRRGAGVNRMGAA